MTIRNPYLFFSTQGQIKCQEFDLNKRFMEDKIEKKKKNVADHNSRVIFMVHGT